MAQKKETRGNPNFKPEENADPVSGEKVVMLGCKYSRGMYHDLKTSRHPNGLHFVGGRCAVVEAELEELKANHLWQPLYKSNSGGEIFRVTLGKPGQTTDTPIVINQASQGARQMEEVQVNAIIEANSEPESEATGVTE
jgi:hypothetical protein